MQRTVEQNQMFEKWRQRKSSHKATLTNVNRVYRLNEAKKWYFHEKWRIYETTK